MVRVCFMVFSLKTKRQRPLKNVGLRIADGMPECYRIKSTKRILFMVFRMRSLAVAGLALLLQTGLAGCAVNPPAGQAPGWIMNPGKGVVASCGSNIKCSYAHEQCDLLRE